MPEGTHIVGVDAVPEDSTYLFTVRDDEGEEREAILARTGSANSSENGSESVACWLNYCQHYRHIKLDKGSGAEMRAREIVCVNHGAMFEADTGMCTFGPCQGAVLESVDVVVEDGDVYLTDDEYEFEREGGMETDPADLSSKSNLEF